MMPSGGLSVTAGQLAVALGAEMLGPASVVLDRVDPIERAGPSSLTFVRDAVFAARLSASGAGAAIVSRAVLSDPGAEAALRGSNRTLLVVDDADLALARILESMGAATTGAAVGVDPAAWVDASATVDPTAFIGPHATVEAGATIGPGTRVLSGARVGVGVRIGRDCVVHHNAVVSRQCVVGDRVILHPGAVIGADGFGYRPDETGRLIKIPHLGTVEIASDVEIGANTTIDRAKLGATTIGAGTKIDNQVQIGHGCVIGASCVICGCVGMAGSVRVGDGVMIGGSACIRDNVTIGDGARIAASASLMDDVPAGESWLGYPARPSREALRALAAAARLPEVLRDLKRRADGGGTGPGGA
jgi:UDP-3-O-[3-hydroxymyristoyl] glucosamine N-acyltransferase